MCGRPPLSPAISSRRLTCRRCPNGRLDDAAGPTADTAFGGDSASQTAALFADGSASASFHAMAAQHSSIEIAAGVAATSRSSARIVAATFPLRGLRFAHGSAPVAMR